MTAPTQSARASRRLDLYQLLDLLDFSEWTRVGYRIHQSPDVKCLTWRRRWRNDPDSPITLDEANRLVAEGKLRKANRILDDRTEVVVKSAKTPLRCSEHLG